MKFVETYVSTGRRQRLIRPPLVYYIKYSNFIWAESVNNRTL